MKKVKLFQNLFFLEANIFLLYPLFFTSISILNGEKITLNILLILIIFLVVSLCSYLILNLIKNKKFTIFLNNLSKFFLIHFLINCFFLPLSIQDGLVDPTAIGINKFNLGISLTISFLLFYVFKNKFKFIRDFNLVISFVIIIFFTYVNFIYYKNINTNINSKTDIKYIEKFNSGIKFGNKNILTLSFDGINPHLVYKNIKDNNRFKDFEFFHNVFSQFPATFNSMSGELFGNLNLKMIGNDDNEIKNNLPYENIAMNKILNSNVYTYAGYNDFNLNDDTKLPYIFNEINNTSNRVINLENKNTLKVYNFTFARIATRFAAKFFDNISKQIIKIFITEEEFKNYDLISKLFFHKGKAFDVNLIPTIIDFKYLINNFSYENSEKTQIKYFHFDFTHFPVDFDKNCNYMSHDANWHKNNQNENGLLNEIVCLTNLLEKFLINLKEQDLYDNTFILIKSDHGQPTYYYKTEPYNIKFNSHNSFGYSRYNSTLMIKPTNSNRPKLKENYETLSLNSTNEILCSYIEEFCKIKINKVSDNLQIYIPKNKKSTYYIDTLKKVFFKNKEELYILEND